MVKGMQASSRFPSDEENESLITIHWLKPSPAGRFRCICHTTSLYKAQPKQEGSMFHTLQKSFCDKLHGHLQPPALHLLETYLFTQSFSWHGVKVPTGVRMFFALTVRPWPVIGQMELLAPRAKYPNLFRWAWLQNIRLNDNCGFLIPF